MMSLRDALNIERRAFKRFIKVKKRIPLKRTSLGWFRGTTLEALHLERDWQRAAKRLDQQFGVWVPRPMIRYV